MSAPAMAPAAVVLRCEALRVGHAGRSLLPPLDLQLRGGELWALVGANGSGKTTLLRTLLGLMPALGGAVTSPPGVRRAYVGPLLPFAEEVPLRVVDLVRGGALRGWRALLGCLRPLGRARLAALLEEMALTHLAGRAYASLSEGQKQRVQLARALASEPHLLFLDEPTSAMDAGHAQRSLALLQRCARRRNVAVVVVGHQLTPLLQVASDVLWLHAADGATPARATQGSCAALRPLVLAEALGRRPTSAAGGPRRRRPQGLRAGGCANEPLGEDVPMQPSAPGRGEVP